MSVELRWHERARELNAYIVEGSMSRFYRVLQYRVDTSNGLGHWNDWEDVPVVRDSSDAARKSE